MFHSDSSEAVSQQSVCFLLDAQRNTNMTLYPLSSFITSPLNSSNRTSFNSVSTLSPFILFDCFKIKSN